MLHDRYVSANCHAETLSENATLHCANVSPTTTRDSEQHCKEKYMSMRCNCLESNFEAAIKRIKWPE